MDFLQAVRWVVKPIVFLLCLQYCAATTFHIYREHPDANLRLWYVPIDSQDHHVFADHIAENMTRFTVDNINIDIEITNEYIVADTFTIMINGHPDSICFFDDNDHQVGDLLNVHISDTNEPSCHLTAGAHSTCQAIL